MGFLGIGMGLVVACLWGLADIFATLAARRLSTFRVTFLSQLTSLLGLILIGAGAFWFSRLFFTWPDVLRSAQIGVFTGCCAALAYLALYRALELGPVAIVGPLTATSPIVTLLLAALILRERLTLAQLGLVLAGILGVILASADLPALRLLLTRFSFSLWTPGVRRAIVATLAFGCLDFGIGASVIASDWYLPGLSTRFFTLIFLLIFARAIQQWRKIHARWSFKPLSQKTPASLSLSGFGEVSALWRASSSPGWGIGFALLVGIIESAAILVFSFDTRLVTTGVTSAIASSYGLVVLLFGVCAYRERLAFNQFCGIVLFMASVVLLALL